MIHVVSYETMVSRKVTRIGDALLHVILIVQSHF